MPAGQTARAGAFGADLVKQLASLEQGNPWFRSRNQLVQWALRAHFPAARDLLDAGCGTGFVLSGLHQAFPRLRLTGVEAGQAGVSVARERVPAARLLLADARALPFEAAFDVVCAFDLLEHIDDDEEVVRQLRRAGRPGSGLLVTVPQHRWLWSDADAHAGHFRRYDRREIEALLVRCGYQILKTTSFVSLLLPALAAYRLAVRRGTPYSVDAELRRRPLADRIAGALYAVERRLIATGISFPAGGSLLVIARQP